MLRVKRETKDGDIAVAGNQCGSGLNSSSPFYFAAFEKGAK